MRLVTATTLLAALSLAAPATTAAADCAGNADALGVGRTVEIDTTGGPGFGFEHYKVYDFLEKGEVVLTFDDGPLPGHTREVLAALAADCTKATFFPVGKLAVGYPEVLKEVAAAGHTIGSHTFTHPDLSKLYKQDPDKAKAEIERTISAVAIANGAPLAPFFRFPFLKDTPELVAYLGQRNIGIFSTDIDSFDFKLQKPDKLIASVMAKLEKHGKGIVLFHDIQSHTAKALPELLKQLKAKGYKIVHLTAKEPVKTLPDVDAEVKKEFKGAMADAGGRPLSAVIKTVGGGAAETGTTTQPTQ